MAERRMFTKRITDSDAFIELPSSAQALYFHLNQGADDDGFNNQIQNAMFKAHATIDDLKLLMCKNFIIRFESGVIVIKHWRMHNTLRKDRYTPTNFTKEFEILGIKDNGSYTLGKDGCHLVAERLPQDSIGKVSIDKVSIVEDSINNNGDFENENHQDISNENEETNVKPSNENEETQSKPSKSEIQKQLETEFAYLWKLYPNKKGKDTAEKKYIYHRKHGTTFEEVKEGLGKYLKEIALKKTPISYIKHGSTWFNQKCWNDEYDLTPTNTYQNNNHANNKNNNSQMEILKGVFDGTIKVN